MMQNEMIHTDRVLIVEGKYDAVRLAHLTDAMILLTDGFGIYSDKKRQQLFKALAQKNGLILLTDSDAAGFRIRNYITNMVGAQNVVQAYVPAIHGKEKRKAQPGKEGLLGVEGVDDALVRQALLDVGLLPEFASRFPHEFSGGQRQRLAMARALLHDTPIYLFDEATSNVDAESENDIMQAIHSLAGKKTIILISHRLANVVHSDCIYAMSNGRVIEQGTHAQLLAKQGAYSRLYLAQRQLETLEEEDA